MACSNIKNELRCKFPPCPCKKCVGLRSERIAGGFCEMRPDTPPEPTSECCDHRNITKRDYTLKEIGPPYRRKCSPTRQKRKKSDRESDLEEEACNPNCSLSIFIINIISFTALVVIGAIVFWLKMCYWTYIFGLYIYHSNRSTQMTALALFGLLILCMCCTYAMGSSGKSSKMLPAENICKGPQQQQPDCDAQAKDHTEIAIEDEGREIFKQSKLYDIPMDMKQPPAFLVYLRSLIFED